MVETMRYMRRYKLIATLILYMLASSFHAFAGEAQEPSADAEPAASSIESEIEEDEKGLDEEPSDILYEMMYSITDTGIVELENLIVQPEIISVEIPVQDMKFILDPFEILKRGQILSSKDKIINYSNTPVKVRISSIYYKFANQIDFLSLDVPYITAEYVSDNIVEKAIYLVMEIDGINYSEQIIITDKEQICAAEFMLEASVYDENNQFVSINEGSTITLSLSGNLNEYAKEPWKKGDVKILIDFDIESVFEELIDMEMTIEGTDYEETVLEEGEAIENEPIKEEPAENEPIEEEPAEEEPIEEGPAEEGPAEEEPAEEEPAEEELLEDAIKEEPKEEESLEEIDYSLTER